MAATEKIWPIILSGGHGTRLWPLSRALYPKQLLPIVSDKSLLQETVERINDLARFREPIVVCSDEHRFTAADQIARLGVRPHTMILEPEARGTAPAAAVAALVVAEQEPDALLLIMPSDHVVEDVAAFHEALDRGAVAARQGRMLTFGIDPLGAETGYGYVERGDPIAKTQGCYGTLKFIEKPDRAAAESYVAAGGYYWNSGIFLFRADRYLEELERLRPEIVEACRLAVREGSTDLGFYRLDTAAFAQCPSDSIDYAVMEHTDAGAVVPVQMGWSDMGSWPELWRLGSKDSCGNVVMGDVVAIDVNGSYLRSEGPLIAALGLRDVVIIGTKDAVFAAPRERAQEVKRVIASLGTADRAEHLMHPMVHRPWGSYETIDAGERFQVKRIVVAPGQQLSLQMHHHRAEHWIVVQGTATVTRGDEIFLLYENQSTYIPAGTRHRLANPGKIPLHLIEVQSGSYLEEDDIVRLEDNYGRR